MSIQVKKSDFLCEHCGHDEFISDPLFCNIYRATRTGYSLVRSELSDQKIRVFCQKCGEEMLDSEPDMFSHAFKVGLIKSWDYFFASLFNYKVPSNW
jgi:hypothetical protein